MERWLLGEEMQVLKNLHMYLFIHYLLSFSCVWVCDVYVCLHTFGDLCMCAYAGAYILVYACV